MHYSRRTRKIKLVGQLSEISDLQWVSDDYLKKLSHVHESKQVSVQQSDTVCFGSTFNTVWKDNSTCDIKGVEPAKTIGSKWLTSVQPTRTNQSQCLQVPPNKTPKRLRCQTKEHFFKSEGLTSAKRLKRWVSYTCKCPTNKHV